MEFIFVKSSEGHFDFNDSNFVKASLPSFGHFVYSHKVGFIDIEQDSFNFFGFLVIVRVFVESFVHFVTSYSSFLSSSYRTGTNSRQKFNEFPEALAFESEFDFE